jgi:hypothetical protein
VLRRARALHGADADSWRSLDKAARLQVTVATQTLPGQFRCTLGLVDAPQNQCLRAIGRSVLSEAPSPPSAPCARAPPGRPSRRAWTSSPARTGAEGVGGGVGALPLRPTPVLVCMEHPCQGWGTAARDDAAGPPRSHEDTAYLATYLSGGRII